MHVRTTLACFMAVLGISLTAHAQSTKSSTVTNYEAPGNLQPSHPIGCKKTDFNSADTPADLYPDAAACLRQGDTRDAELLFALAGTYGRYDILRVTDESSHDAPMLLRSRAFSPFGAKQLKAFSARLVADMHDDKFHAGLCRKLAKVGPPTYYPRYMTQHGMGAFLNPHDSHLAIHFDPAANWSKVMHDFAECGVSAGKS